MAPSPRLSDRELAAINAAAVTKEYSVKPHLGELHWLEVFSFAINFFFSFSFARLPHCLRCQWVSLLEKAVCRLDLRLSNCIHLAR